MPDVAVILGNGAVGGEHPGFGNVHQTLAPPAHGVAGVIAEGLPFADDIGVEIRQGCLLYTSDAADDHCPV